METNEKLSFFKKIKIAIFNLEKYGLLIVEDVGRSIRYMAILVLICSICFSILDTIDSMKMLDKGMNYIVNEMSNFTVKDGEIFFENKVYGYDEEYDIQVISIDKYNLTDSELEESEKYGKTIIFLKDKLVLNTYGVYNEYSYNYIKEAFNIEQGNKQEIINLYNELGGNTGISITMFITFVFAFFIVNAYEIIIYCLIVAIFGYFVAQIGKIKIKFSTAVTLSIYSLTLSVLLNLIYVVQYNLTGFEVPYFNLLYLVIAYIYIVAAILIIKTDLIRQVMELQRIEQEKNKMLQENENREQQDKKEEQNKEDKKDKDNEEDNSLDKEPDGSEI